MEQDDDEEEKDVDDDENEDTSDCEVNENRQQSITRQTPEGMDIFHNMLEVMNPHSLHCFYDPMK